MCYSGVAALVGDLRILAGEWGLTSVAATRALPDGHRLTLKVTGELLTIERDDGVLVSVPADSLPCDE